MSTFGKITFVILGLALLLPGLCFIGFGLFFGLAKLQGENDMYGFLSWAPYQLLIGAVLTILAILIFRRIGK